MKISSRFLLTATILLVSNEGLCASERLIQGVARTSMRGLSSRVAQSVVSGHSGQHVFATRKYSNTRSLYNKAFVLEGSTRKDLVEAAKFQPHNPKILELEELQSKIQMTNSLLEEIIKRLETASVDIQKIYINSHVRINGFSSNNVFSVSRTDDAPIQRQRNPLIQSTPPLQDSELESSADAKSNLSMREITPSTDRSDIDALRGSSSDLLTNDDHKPESELVNTKKATYSTASSVFSSERPEQREERRLYRIYGLLPEYHSKSITGVLSGATINKQLPAWEAVKKAIAKIQEEALTEGDQTLLDLDYFRRVYSKIVETSPNGLPANKDKAYSISQQEIERLNRIYELLPEWNKKSITGVLSGATRNEQVPAWEAVKKAIAKIQEEALATGDKTIIDLDYFRKLHWSSMRVRGAGGGRKSADKQSEQLGDLSTPQK